MITLLGLSLPAWSGAFVTETVFGWPGMGRQRRGNRQPRLPVIMGVTMVSALIVVLGNFMANIAYAWWIHEYATEPDDKPRETGATPGNPSNDR
jgi:ABC-type dipeptide/oligopeptide/nickel transport system permease component